MWGSDWLLASVAPEVDLGECTLHSPPQKVNKAEPTLALNPEEMSPEIQNRGTIGPKNFKKGHVSAKNFKKKEVSFFAFTASNMNAL